MEIILIFIIIKNSLVEIHSYYEEYVSFALKERSKEKIEMVEGMKKTDNFLGIILIFIIIKNSLFEIYSYYEEYVSFALKERSKEKIEMVEGMKKTEC